MTPFDPKHGLVIISVMLFGPTGNRSARLALDTGATASLVSKEILVVLGYDPDSLPQTVRFTTRSGVEQAARLPVDKIEAFDQERLNFPFVAHTLPPSATVDGVLGLDFFRNHVLTLDFQKGEISLS